MTNSTRDKVFFLELTALSIHFPPSVSHLPLALTTMTSTLDAVQSSATETTPKNKPQGEDNGADEKAISKSRTDLLDAEGDLSPAFHLALARIFLRFSASAKKLGLDLPNAATASEKDVGAQLEKLKKVALDDDELDAFARATNGEVLSDESKEEIKEYLDCDDQSRITVR